MLDPATFRRVNPNYQISYIKPKEAEGLFGFSDDEDSDEDGCCSCGGGSDGEDEDRQGSDSLEKKFDSERPRYKYKWDKNERGDTVFMAVEVDEDGDPLRQNRAVDKLAEDANTKNRVFTEEELLLTSPVMLGFAFSEKLWLEFTISGVSCLFLHARCYGMVADTSALPDPRNQLERKRLRLARSPAEPEIHRPRPGREPQVQRAQSHRRRRAGQRQGPRLGPPRPSRHRQDADRRRHLRDAAVPAIHGVGWRAGHGSRASGA